MSKKCDMPQICLETRRVSEGNGGQTNCCCNPTRQRGSPSLTRRVTMARHFWIALLFGMLLCASAAAQSVCFPAPRLLTTMPMGGRAGTQVELAITGEHLEDIEKLLFSHPGITAAAKLRGDGTPEPNQFVVSIAAEVPPGIHEARVMSRLGISSTRVFTVSTHDERKQDKPSTTIETAMPLGVDTICNSTIPAGGINHYTFEAKQGDRIVIDCAAKGIDSKLKPVLIVADTMGRDLLVERRGGALDFRSPADGLYVIKVHDLTFKGGAEYFYRLAVQKFAADAPLTRLPSTRTVSCFSWPPDGLPPEAALAETEPNNQGAQSQKITLPTDIRGSFYPAADVDTFEFNAKKGEVWWIELASERLGCPTDSSVIVQRVTSEGASEKLVDVAELPDILSPVKRSSNGYAYDGPPYNAGSTDALGKIEIPEDGTYRLQVLDLFGGTRSDPRNVYRLIVRRAAPDFTLVAWGLHLELRNGDRNALSKPLALRGGSTVALEVVAVRRDGFDGEIELTLENLPAGVTSAGLKIPAGGSRGIMLVTASQDAPRGLTEAKFYGSATINGTKVERRCHWASPAWPIRDSWSEVPVPRLVNSFPVSVGGSEVAPISIAPRENKTLEVVAGETQTLKIPLAHVRRGQFSGATMSLKTFGAGFESMPAFDVSLDADQSEAVVDLAKLKTPPGEYRIAFYGSAVAKYRYNPRAVDAAELSHQQAQAQATAAANELDQVTRQASAAATEQKASFEQSVKVATDKKKAADEAVATAVKKLAEVKKQAEPSDIVDIVVSEPITIRVQPAEKK